MAGDILNKFGTSGQSLTITMAGVVANAGRESTAVDNSSNKWVDAQLVVKIRTGPSGTSSTGMVAIFAYGSVDGGSTYSGNATGTDGNLTPMNMVQIGSIAVAANATDYKSAVLSVAAAFGGSLPERWGIAILNLTGATLDATGSNFSAKWQGVAAQYT